ncbi:AmmeMemoRadiSam system protein B [Sansalvadorimonas sp. 2012CJ34-2]|uniref:MEMO1 family protein M3P05_11410 n=1 Tax=Parendozoicomonas callyspongiae TaxID=2942213 RepID=A0ABT0PGL2_9GAMM|nr:AmmeMemoRadiSam system protein B [Sansalvadorimonas sp. 2012CJ34-2]MCL6270530.1 AmmeMemoRadiSam system protein B [Sansalvadorimonas sp. 2012CJ34-2]
MSVRQPAVAGSFYPANSTTLKEAIARFLNEANSRELSAKVLIVPHAGYIYSGPVAASAYKLLESRGDEITRVVVLGPSHRALFEGLALPNCNTFNTPLGHVPLDSYAIENLLSLSQVHTLEAAHELEHSLEVQIPFLQTCLDSFTLIPLVVGEASPLAVSEVLEMLWGGSETLIIISTDLSHYHSYDEACSRDASTVRAIERLDHNLTGGQACGCRPLNGLLQLAQQKGMKITTLDVRNSGDTAGDAERVVGYGAFAAQ